MDKIIIVYGLFLLKLMTNPLCRDRLLYLTDKAPDLVNKPCDLIDNPIRPPDSMIEIPQKKQSHTVV